MRTGSVTLSGGLAFMLSPTNLVFYYACQIVVCTAFYDLYLLPMGLFRPTGYISLCKFDFGPKTSLGLRMNGL